MILDNLSMSNEVSNTLSLVYSLGRNSVTYSFMGLVELNWINLKRMDGCESATAVIAAKSLQSCPTLCDPIDGSPPASTIPGILQARTLEWVAISFSNAWKWKVKVKSLSRVRVVSNHKTKLPVDRNHC